MTETEFQEACQAFANSSKAEGIYCIRPMNREFIVERIIRPPVPQTRFGVGAYGYVTLNHKGDAYLDIGPCTISEVCAPDDVPFTTDNNTSWFYWGSTYSPTISSDEVQAFAVGFSDLIVRLKKAYPELEIGKNRFEEWKAKQPPQFGFSTY